MGRLGRYVRLSYSVSRPSLSVLAALSYLLGLYWNKIAEILKSGSATGGLPRPELEMLISMFSAGVFANLLNSYRDSLDVDRLAYLKKDCPNPFLEYGLSPRAAGLLALAAGATSVILSCLARPKAVLLVTAELVISVAYSLYPRLKGVPVADVVLNTAALYAIPFALGWTRHEPLSELPLLEALASSLVASPLFLLTAIVDYHADLRAGLATTVVKLGLRRSALACLVMHSAGSLLIASLLPSPHTAIPLIIVEIAYLVLVKRPTPMLALKIVRGIAAALSAYCGLAAIYLCYTWRSNVMPG